MADYCEDNIETHPHCLHGPTLLFLRKKSGRKFFACSAFRDRKKCRFFQWIDKDVLCNKTNETESFVNVLETFKTRRNILKQLRMSSMEKYYCHTCDMFTDIEDKRQHLIHELEKKVNSEILYPTSILKPIEQAKGEAQFHFSDKTVKTISNFFLELAITGVLCVGCPRLHEYIINSSRSKKISSLLLDIDHRYLQFYDPDKFQMFNMYNCHFFDKNGWSFLKTVTKTDKVAIIADPPFGGRMEPLAYSINRLISMIKENRKWLVAWENILVLLILPYFMEPAVKKQFPHFHMLDYKVEYRNHRQFRNKGNRGSAIRIFTNFPPSSFKLSAEEGYKYCTECDRWVGKENEHCFKCGICPSKNGGTYKHCDKCRICVKITWLHCSICNVCKLELHNCSWNRNTIEGICDINDESEILIKKKRKLIKS